MKKPRLKVYEIRRASYLVWAMWLKGKRILGCYFSESRAQFISRCAKWCREVATVEVPISLRICRRDGSIIEERTYPRSADPRRSKG